MDGNHWAAAKSQCVAAGKMENRLANAAIGLLLYQTDLFGLPTAMLGYYLLWAAAALTLWSMVIYLHAARQAF